MKSLYSYKVFVLVALVVVAALFSTSSVYAEDFIEVMNLNETDLRNTMDVSVMSCIENAQNVVHNIVCKNTFNTVELPTIAYNDTCDVSYLDLNDFECVDISLQAIFDRDGERQKLTNDIHAKQVFLEPKIILESQEWDGGWKTASDTAYAIWILGQFPDKFSRQIEDGLRWLKDNRDDDTKCWATDAFSSTCSIYETSRSLGFLSLAGYNDSFRVKSDGRIWLESRQNYIESDDGWELHVKPRSDGNCTIKAGSSTLYDDDVTDDERYELDFTPEYGLLINLSCSVSTGIIIYDHIGRNIFAYTFDSSDEYDFDYALTEDEDTDIDRDAQRYRFNPPCWSATQKWDYCNIETTLYSLIPELDTSQRNLALDWFEGQLGNDTIRGKYVRTRNQLFDSALYLYAISGKTSAEEEDVLEWLVYNQNNDGSWGDGDKQERALPTAMAVLALKNQSFESKSEVLDDARSWFSTYTPLKGWDNVKQDAVSFMVLKDNSRPYLKIHPEIPSVISGQTKLTLFNPTEHDANELSYELQGDVKGALTVTVPDNVSRYKNRTLTLTPSASDAGMYSGIVYIKNSSGVPMVSFPVTVQSSSNIQVKIANKVSLIAGQGSFTVDVTSSNINKQCDVRSDDLGINKKISSSKGKKDVQVNIAPATGSSSAQVSVVCQTDDGDFSFENDIQVTAYATEPFTILTEELTVKKPGKKNSIILLNNLNDTINVSLSVSSGSDFFEVESSVVELPVDKKTKVYITNRIPVDVNLTESGTFTASVGSYKQELDFAVDINYDPNAGDWIWMVVYLVIFVIVLGGVGYLGYYYRQPLNDFMRQSYDAILPRLPPSIAKYIPGAAGKIDALTTPDQAGGEPTRAKQKDNSNAYYEDIVRIMKSLGKQDGEIRERLAAEGLSEQRMDVILAELSKAEDLEAEIKHEDQVKSLLESVANEDGEVFRKLRDQGYTEDQIKESMEELEQTVKQKKENLSKDLEELE